MEVFPSLVISRDDFQKISTLLAASRLPIVEQLEEELGRAEIVSADQLPQDIVAMNSEVTFEDLDSGLKQTVILAYPDEAHIESSKVSILAPVGAALIGLKVGQSIEWPLADHKRRRLKIFAVKQNHRN